MRQCATTACCLLSEGGALFHQGLMSMLLTMQVQQQQQLNNILYTAYLSSRSTPCPAAHVTCAMVCCTISLSEHVLRDGCLQVGNGDVICVSSALSLLQETGCDAIMVGRGALQDPLIFHRIQTHFNSSSSSSRPQQPKQCHHVHEDNVPQQLQYTQHAAAVQAVQAASVQQLQQQQYQRRMQEVDEAAVVADFLQRYAACGWRSNVGGAREVVRMLALAMRPSVAATRCTHCMCQLLEFAHTAS